MHPTENEPARRLAAFAAYLVEKLGNIGVLIAIRVPGKPRLHVEVGRRSLEGAEPIARSDLYQIGSQTKMLTAVATMALARDGFFALDDPVVRHLPLEIDGRITIRHLIANTSGLGEFTDVMMGPCFDPRVEHTPRDLVAMARTQGQIFEPGTRFDYCNTGWAIAALLIEAASGKAYADILSERVLHPLGLTNTFIGAGGQVPVGRMAHGYVKTGAETVFDAARLPLSWAIGSGDAVSCCDDMLDLVEALSRSGNATGISLADMRRDARRPSLRPKYAMSIGTEYGYGLQGMQWAGPMVWGHRGGTLGYNSSTWIDPEKQVSVATCVTRVLDLTEGELSSLRYPGPQIFAMALATAYALTETG